MADYGKDHEYDDCCDDEPDGCWKLPNVLHVASASGNELHYEASESGDVFMCQSHCVDISASWYVIA